MPEHESRERVALVTGASSGVGRETALGLAGAGFRVFAAARREEPLRRLASEAKGIEAMTLDVTDRQAVDEAVTSIGRGHDGLDVLVCAAGVNVPRRRFADVSLEDWRRIMDINATGTFNVAQSCLPLLRARSGLVIVIASVSSRWPDASGAAYQASKRAVLGLAHAIALEERGLRVSAVLPGIIDTPLLDARPTPPPAEVRAQAIKPGDVADICVFLAGLSPRIYLPEVVVMPSALQRIGSTS